MGKNQPDTVSQSITSFSSEGESKPIRILVVDDDNLARETLGELLSMSEFCVKTTSSAKEALDILVNTSFDIIISDLVMPKMDGIALTKAIKEMGLDIPIIVMTGFATIEHAVESMKAGASDFITKPFNFDQIQIIIKKTLETKKLKELAKEREYYKTLSNIDGLTEVNNYRYFSQILDTEIKRQTRYKGFLSLMMIDIDNFKHYNDTYGHLIGDMVLKQVAYLIKKTTRGCDFVARYGGEEFAVILPETSDKEAVVVAERIRREIENFKFETHDGVPLEKVTVTIGIASFPKDAQDKKTLIDKADKALYMGKAKGKNCVFIYDEEKMKEL